MNCINTNDKSFKELLEASKLPSLLLEMRIAKWQEQNGLDSFPKVEDIIQSNDINISVDSISEKDDEKIIESLNKFAKDKKVNLNFVEFEDKEGFITGGNYDTRTHTVNLNKNKINRHRK